MAIIRMSSNQPFLFTTEQRKQALNGYSQYLAFLIFGIGVATIPSWKEEGRIDYDPWEIRLCLGLALVVFLAGFIGINFQRGAPSIAIALSP